MSYRVWDQERRAKACETLVTSKDIPHTYNVGSAEARMLTIARGEFENFIRAFGRPIDSDGLPDPSKLPTSE